MLEVRDVTKRFGAVKAVANASFTISTGERAAFFGGSGAGKTTLMNLLTGYTSCTHGSIAVDGFDMLKNPVRAKKPIGYLPCVSPVYMDMTLTEYLGFLLNLKHVPKEERDTHAAQAAESCGLSNKLGSLIHNLSRGEQRRAALAGALCGNPDFLICDEPTLGLEPDQIVEMRNAITRAAKTKTLIIATSALTDATELCEKIFIMRAGSIVAEDSLHNLSLSAAGKKRVCVRLAASKSTAAALLKTIEGADSIEYAGCKEPETCDFVIESYQKDVRADIFHAAANAGIVLLGIKPMSVTIEDVFSGLISPGGGLVP